MKKLDWPLMENNITRQDRLAASNFFLEGNSQDLHDTKLTNGPQVQAFEEEFAAWQGSKYAVMVNSGASANQVTMTALAQWRGNGEVIVPCIAWVSDVASILHAGLTPVFVDVLPDTLGADPRKILEAITPRTKAVFLTHCLGFSALSSSLVGELSDRDIVLFEDCCESIGATHEGRKVGSFGMAANFSFYYAHHMSTIEGGMVCTDDMNFYQHCRLLRSHGLVRELSTPEMREHWAKGYPDLHPEFIFAHAGFNMRSTEVNAVIGRAQLKRLDANIEKRSENLRLFLSCLDLGKYRTEYHWEGSSNYALPLVLNDPDTALMGRVLAVLQESVVEYRRGTAGGGNQLRQPYARQIWGQHYHKQFPQAEHIHDFGLYIGNYPDLEQDKIVELCERLRTL